MLRHFIDQLRQTPPLERGEPGMAGLLSTASATSIAFPLISRPNGYTRICAYRDERFEVVLLNWAPGAASPIHDHGDQHCWMAVLDGRLEVEDFERLDAGDVPGYARVETRDTHVLEPGQFDLRSGRFALHRVGATRNASALSLHVYSLPLRAYLVYDETARRCETAVGKYDEVLPVYTDGGGH
ncbi:MAG: cysteine dioxygenase family protein [Candidatus Baltobacteraceae bacterium]